MSLFDQWSTDLQKTFKSLAESANWKPAEVMGDLAASEAKIAEKLLHQQNRYMSDSFSQLSKHLVDLMTKKDPLAVAEANYSFFCEQQVKASSQYLSALDLVSEARDLMTEKMNTAFTR